MFEGCGFMQIQALFVLTGDTVGYPDLFGLIAEILLSIDYISKVAAEVLNWGGITGNTAKKRNK